MTPDRHQAQVVDPSSTLVTATAQATVVVVDDTPANVTLLARLLASAGITQVHGFTDLRQAVEHCARALPDTDATIIAEGIETPHELATLQRIGIPWGQGYHLARPAALPLPPQTACSPQLRSVSDTKILAGHSRTPSASHDHATAPTNSTLGA